MEASRGLRNVLRPLLSFQNLRFVAFCPSLLLLPLYLNPGVQPENLQPSSPRFQGSREMMARRSAAAAADMPPVPPPPVQAPLCSSGAWSNETRRSQSALGQFRASCHGKQSESLSKQRQVLAKGIRRSRQGNPRMLL